MRKLFAMMLVACLCVTGFIPMASAMQTVPDSSLSSLTNNCTNTGIMLPQEFSPTIYTYLLTVASWVSRVTLTPISTNPNAAIEVNGSRISSGQTSQYFAMTDEPQIVTISVTTNSGSSLYGIFLQRRPNDGRTSVSAGYLSDLRMESGKTNLVMDLVTVTYTDGNADGFTNDAIRDHFAYPVTQECIFYYGSAVNPMRAIDLADFKQHVTPGGKEMYQIIYLEDEIAVVLPFAYGLIPAV